MQAPKFDHVCIRTNGRLDHFPLALPRPSRSTRPQAVRAALLSGLDALDARIRAGERIEAPSRRGRAA